MTRPGVLILCACLLIIGVRLIFAGMTQEDRDATFGRLAGAVVASDELLALAAFAAVGLMLAGAFYYFVTWWFV